MSISLLYTPNIISVFSVLTTNFPIFQQEQNEATNKKVSKMKLVFIFLLLKPSFLFYAPSLNSDILLLCVRKKRRKNGQNIQICKMGEILFDFDFIRMQSVLDMQYTTNRCSMCMIFQAIAVKMQRTDNYLTTLLQPEMQLYCLEECNNSLSMCQQQRCRFILKMCQ